MDPVDNTRARLGAAIQYNQSSGDPWRSLNGTEITNKLGASYNARYDYLNSMDTELNELYKNQSAGSYTQADYDRYQTMRANIEEVKSHNLADPELLSWLQAREDRIDADSQVLHGHLNQGT